MIAELFPYLMLVSLAILLFTGFPVGAILAGIGVAFAGWGIAIGEFPIPSLFLLPNKVYSAIGENLTYPAIPMLLFMGVALEVSGASRELLLCLERVLSRMPGRFYASVILVGLLLAPMAGVVGASVATIAIAALPTMLERRLPLPLATGAVAAAGTLGVIAPPAVMLFFLADKLEITVGSMFLAPLPAIVCLTVAFIFYFAISDRTHSETQRAMVAPPDELGLLAHVVRAIVLPVGLIVGVLTSIAAGVVAPSESAAVGAVGAAALIFVYRGFQLDLLWEALRRTMTITAMVFFVVIGASIFSLVFRFYGGDDVGAALFQHVSLPDLGILASILFLLFILGFFIDWIEIVLVSLPILLPVIQSLDFSGYVGSTYQAHVWIATLIALVLQTSFLTPPFGFALFFLKGSSPPEVSMAAIYKGVAPIVAIQIAMILTVFTIPAIATWLPMLFLG